MTQNQDQDVIPTPEDMVFESSEPLDPLKDAEDSQSKNRAKVGSARPSSLLYTFGVGSIVDLPSFSIMPAGLDDWEPILKRRTSPLIIDEPRLLKVVQLHLGPRVTALRPFPWQPSSRAQSREGIDLGVPARVFPQWLRCTGCDYLGPLSRFTYTNTHPYRPDLACFEHRPCPKRGRSPAVKPATTAKAAKSAKAAHSQAVPARYLLACPDGHLDEFPYSLWVHRGQPCSKAPSPELKLHDTNIGQGAGAVVVCVACGLRRSMSEAQGDGAERKRPVCRGRHPHLNAFDKKPCENKTKMIMMGASNLWFAATQSIIVMPRSKPENRAALANIMLTHLTPEKIARYSATPGDLREVLAGRCDLEGVSEQDLAEAARESLTPDPSDEERKEQLAQWDPIELLVPEWEYLQLPNLFAQQENASGLMVTEMARHENLSPQVLRVVAVNKMKKVNAVIGFTRIDEMDRVNDLASRLVKLTRSGRPTWVPATEDSGEGVFIQLDEKLVADWEARVQKTELWELHRVSHERNFRRRFSATAADIKPDLRLPPPRYWLVHTLAHLLIREMAMYCGYGAASLSERLYAWQARPGGRPAAAGLLICTTASDSDGTLGGLVALSDSERLEALVTAALRRASRCSSDPVCAQRTPSDPEDFLHGAACHCCCFASETSCEKANRFLDRRFLIQLPTSDGAEIVPAFFGRIDDV